MRIIRLAINNPVAVNIVMLAVIGFGLFTAFNITREFFPESDLDRIVITTPYPGATPEDVEKGVITKIENAVESLDHVEEVTSQALENIGLVIIKVNSGADIDKLADEVRNDIDRIDDMPEDAEESYVEVLEPIIPAISIVIYGTASERRLKRMAEEVKDDLLASNLISNVIVSGTRAEEISVEVKPEKLETYNLALEEVGRAVRANNIDLAGGEIKAPGGKVVVRTLGEEDQGPPLEEIIVQSGIQGNAIRLGMIADVRDTFEDKAIRGSFEGYRAVQVTIFKTGDEDAVRISNHAKKYLAEKEKQYASETAEGEPAIAFAHRVDLARFISQRIELLARNGLQGLVLVFIALALFLNLRLAFWVGTGLVVSFLGTFIIMDAVGATVNMISLFGLIIVIGLIVDDAIVVSENIYAKLEEGKPSHIAALEGAEEVVRPVIATVLTTIVAFAPLAFIKGVVGDFLSVLPVVVIAALALSLIECFTLLPSHLAEFGKAPAPRGPEKSRHGFAGRIRYAYMRVGEKKDDLLNVRFNRVYTRLLRIALGWRYVTLSIAAFISMVTLALLLAGLLPFVLFPKVDAETMVVEVEMTQGTSAEETEQVLKNIAAVGRQYPEMKSIYTVVGFKEEAELQNSPDPDIIGEVIAELTESEERTRTSQEIVNQWRTDVGRIPGTTQLKFREREGGPGGPEIEVRVRAPNQQKAELGMRFLKERLSEFAGVKDIEDDAGTGKLELRVRLKDTARTLGLTEASIANQVRNAYFGYEAQTLQRGQEEVKVWVRLDETSRKEMASLLRLRVATPSGERVPLQEVADVEVARGLASITRVDGMRTMTVTADVDFALANTSEVTAALEEQLTNLPPELYGVRYSFEGTKKETAESVNSLAYGFPIALILIYCILAVLFKSYIQPIMVMITIPYAVIGASLGHLIFGFIPGRDFLPITFMSLIGMVGLSGIVVNDSLILVTFINHYRREHPGHLFDAVVQAGQRRLRPILLTSITTVLGLAPIMLETSFQAQFLIPTAVAISFGLILATLLTLLLLPCIYMVIEDLRTLGYWLKTGEWKVVRLKPEEFLATEEQLQS